MLSIKYDDNENDDDDDQNNNNNDVSVEPITTNIVSNACGNVFATTKERLLPITLTSMIIKPISTTTLTTTSTTLRLITKEAEERDKMLPSELSDNVTIDNFNSRRRRGRLRPPIPITLAVPLTSLQSPTTILLQKNRENDEKSVSTSVERYIYNNDKEIKINMKMKLLLDEESKVKKDEKKKCVSMIKRATNIKLFAVKIAPNIACHIYAVYLLLKLLMLLSLLKFIVKFVYKYIIIIIIKLMKINKIIIVLKATCASNIMSNVIASAPSSAKALASEVKECLEMPSTLHCKTTLPSFLYKTTTTTAITTTTTSRSNNNYNNSNNNNNNNNTTKHKLYNNNAGILYAMIIFTSLLLPCSNNIVSAARPKPAQNQLQQQQQQHQQDRENHQNSQQPQQTAPAYEIVSPAHGSLNDETEFLSSQSQEKLFDAEDDEQNLKLNLNEDITSDNYDTHRNDTNITIVQKSPLFPKDLFTKEQLENGAVVFHIIGVIYMFVALAIVCDEFFVPSLDVIIEKLDITDDVAGATFMAAGGSAPELFTSVIGVFVSFDDVGIGTIVGSAVFNILFVIGMCALFSKTVLTLTWWPLFRDCSFYSISLLVLIYFFRDSMIFWWEALILFSIYICYVGFMKWNVQVEHCVKKVITKNKVTRVRSTDQLMPAGNAANSSETSMATQPGGSVTSRAASESRSGPPGSSSGACGTTGNSSSAPGSTHTGAKFRHGLLQLMIHTIDPLHDDDVPGKVDEKATQLHAIASLKVLLDATKPQRGGATTSAANHVKINLKETTLADRPNGNIDTTLESANEIEDEPEPLSMAWPDTARKRLTYILVAPLLIPMWLTLPDTRTPRGKRFFPVTFIGSILWIAAFSYLMVWWANVAGDTARIPPEVMGLTFLAAGTSIPDLITSVIVARKGFGDMAVSSSVGSNIFDVTVGLPVPWLLYGIIYSAPVEVNSQGMVCSITILFMMLIFVVLSIACFRWRMNKGLGFTMFLLYFVFVAVSLMFEYKVITCPV